MLRAGAAVLAAAGIACATAPGSQRAYTIAPGVKIARFQVGGLPAPQARAEIQRALNRPIEIVYRGETILVEPRRLGAGASIDRAVRAALAATPGSTIKLPARFSKAATASYVAELAREFDRKARDAQVIGASASSPLIVEGRMGLAVDRPRMRQAIERHLTTGSRAPIVLMVRSVRPTRSSSSFGSVVVIDRGRNTLKLFSGRRLVRQFGVSTGTATYPTPSGVFSIVSMQRDPWWLPPSSPWAEGLDPVPPGPGNPLGTRWMGLSVPAVGIHGTPDAASIGYSQSHGCIRMRVPEAEWLFTKVDVGTPVVIL